MQWSCTTVMGLVGTRARDRIGGLEGPFAALETATG